MFTEIIHNIRYPQNTNMSLEYSLPYDNGKATNPIIASVHLLVFRYKINTTMQSIQMTMVNAYPCTNTHNKHKHNRCDGTSHTRNKYSHGNLRTFWHQSSASPKKSTVNP
eukprot:1119746_1